MFDTVGDIKKAVKRREGDLEDLRRRMDDDFDLWSLKEYEPASKAYEAYTTSSPKNFFNKVVDGLNRAILTITIELPEDATDEQREAAEIGELYVHGGLGAIDRTLRNRGEPPLRQSASFLMGVRGWCCFRALVYVPEGEEDTVFDVAPWDMRHVTWEQGPRGLIWAAYKRKVDNSQIQDEYGLDMGRNGETWVIDFWDGKKNCVIVRDDFAKPPKEHKIGHVPVWLGAVGAMPTMQAGTDADSTSSGSQTGSLMKYRGQSAFDASRGIYKPWNKYVAGLMDMHKKAQVGSLFHKSKGAKAKIVGDPHESFRIIPGDLNETLEPLASATAPPETGPLLKIIGEDLDQASLPNPLAFGGTNAPESGRALAIRIDATRSVFNPFTGMLSEAYTWLVEELLGQFANKGLKPADMFGFRPQESLKEDQEPFFRVTVKPEDIDPGWFVLATVEPRLPRDEENEIIMAIQATAKKPGEQPLMSKRSARGDILHVRNPDAEERRILIEEGESHPVIQARRIAKSLIDVGKHELAAEVLGALESPQGQGPGRADGASQIPEDLLRRVVETLVQGGNPEVAQQLVQAIEGGPPPPAEEGPAPPEQESAAQQGLPAETIQLIRELAQALVEAGEQELAVTFVEALESGEPISGQLVEQIVQVLITAGREDLAERLMELLGVGVQQAGTPPATNGQTAPVPAPQAQTQPALPPRTQA
ncbi:hypothetical protein CMI37_21000 [Candidatus Pacearchaeota archaeon]|nr:hypothetical protein [Candidatus Pacearchaeota archaeon]